MTAAVDSPVEPVRPRSCPTLVRDADAPARWTIRKHDTLGAVVLFAVAFLLRWGMTANSPGGLSGNMGDDASAYYTGADAIIHGRLPYRDFVLLHPPLLDLVLTPFALFGALTSDHVGFMAANVAIELMGAVSAVLVVAVSRRFGLARAAAWTGGIFYALWYGAIASEVGIRLEALATFVTLLGLLALTGRARRRNVFLGGFAFGAAAVSKIWGVVPLAIMVLWLVAFRRTRRSTPAFVAGLVVAGVVICGPFFVMAPRSMFRSIVTAQLGRKSSHLQRVDRMTGLFDVFPKLIGHAATLTMVLIVVLLVVVAVLALRVPTTRVVVLLAFAEIVVLYKAPSFFTNYDGLVAATLAITVAAAAHAVGMPWPRVTLAARTAGVAVLAVLVVGAAVQSVVAVRTVPFSISSKPFPYSLMARAVRGAHCPTPDGPIVLIETNTLSSTLSDGCPNWVDVSGRLYDIDKAPQGAGYPRAKNKKWQRDLHRYLLSGDVVVIFRPKLGIGPALRAEIESFPLIGRKDGFSAFRVPASRRTGGH